MRKHHSKHVRRSCWERTLLKSCPRRQLSGIDTRPVLEVGQVRRHSEESSFHVF